MDLLRGQRRSPRLVEEYIVRPRSLETILSDDEELGAGELLGKPGKTHRAGVDSFDLDEEVGCDDEVELVRVALPVGEGLGQLLVAAGFVAREFLGDEPLEPRCLGLGVERLEGVDAAYVCGSVVRRVHVAPPPANSC